MPSFSVIVPVYNRVDFIGRCLESIASQDCIPEGDIEILVVDDGSTDGTQTAILEFMRKCNKQLVKYEPIKHVGEPGTVRNVALTMAQGEFLGYCDSDDVWLPHHLATAKQAFKKYPSMGMVSNYWGLAQFVVVRGPNGTRIINNIVVPPHPTWAVNTNCRVHRRECVSKVGMFNTSKWGEDGDFFGRIEKAYPTLKTGIVTSINGYIKGGNNLSFQFDKGIKGRYF